MVLGSSHPYLSLILEEMDVKMVMMMMMIS